MGVFETIDLENDSLAYRTFEEMMKNIGEQVIKLINEALLKIGKSELNEANKNCIKTLIVDLSSKNLLENSVYKLLCKLISGEFLTRIIMI